MVDGFFLKKSLTSINQPCPISEANQVLWDSGTQEGQDLARERKRRLHYVSNVYIIKDSENPDAEGKVWLWEYGAKVFKKITDAMKPEFPDETPINPFDIYEGANFKLKIATVSGFRNYDRSEFGNPGPLTKDKKVLELIDSSLYSLKEFTDPSKYKTYDELKKRLDEVLGNSTPISTAEQMAMEDSAKPASVGAEVSNEPSEDTTEEDESAEAFFQEMANK